MKTYKIKKGDHYCSPKIFKIIPLPNKREFSWLVNIDDRLVYDVDGEDQNDISKLLGISLFDFVPNDKNSIRLGYSYNKVTKKIHLYPYFHVNGKINFQSVYPFPQITPTKEGVLYKVTINVYTDSWEIILINDRTKEFVSQTMKLTNPKRFNFAYENNFYFGGNKTAPKDLFLEKESI